MARESLIFAGGGTGGHLFPGLALADELRRRSGHRRVVFLGTGRPVEQRTVAASGYELRLVLARPLRGRDLADRARSMGVLPLALAQAAKILVELRPAAAIGLGGYASGPVILAAALLGIPTAVMEQNSVPGSTNRLLGKLRVLRRAYVSFPSSAKYFPGGVARSFGNPVRQALTVVRSEPFPAQRSLLVLGGSQGARRLNLSMPEALAKASAAVGPIEVVHQTGDAMAEAVRRSYDELDLPARVSPFIEDMAAAYRAARLVVCRAGATTVAELGVVGRPAVFVPFPHAIDDHQTLNARELEEQGAAVVLADADATPERLAAVVTELLADEGRLDEMARRAAAWGAPDATARVADDVEALMWSGRGTPRGATRV